MGCNGWKDRIAAIRIDARALRLARRDPRVPWYAKAMLAAVASYALSPVDLIPDFIPVVGYLDDLIIVPLGIAIAIRFIPGDVWREYQQKATVGQAVSSFAAVSNSTVNQRPK